ncbi:MAG: CrcB family protein [Clostridiales bacterium]|nr:CrcB family protein [Clostridiales bacterium]
MKSLLFVGAGGFIGACARYLITKALDALPLRFAAGARGPGAIAGFFMWLVAGNGGQKAALPLGTLASNVIAGFFVGLIIGSGSRETALPADARLFLTTGLLGGLSTFSTFSLETAHMLESGQYAHALANAALNLGLSLLCVFAGFGAAKWLR